MLKYYIHAHQNKELAFADTLSKEYEHVKDMHDADICFYDHDAIIGSDRFKHVQDIFPAKRLYFVYPHAGRPSILGDLYPTSELTAAQFVSAQGHVDIMRAFGYEKPLVVTGWHLSPINNFRPFVGNVPRILFAPIHPRMSNVDKKLNASVHGILVRLAAKKEIILTVRYVRSLELSGIKPSQGVNYCEGSHDSSYSQILQNDLVISHQTYAYMSVALGVPTLMMGEDVVPHNFRTVGHKDEMVYVRSWPRYKDMMAYPLDILATSDPIGLIQDALASDDKILDWKRRMIGEPFDENVVLNIVKSHLAKH